MTTSAPQWPGQDEPHAKHGTESDELAGRATNQAQPETSQEPPPMRPTLVPLRTSPVAVSGEGERAPREGAGQGHPGLAPAPERVPRRLRVVPGPADARSAPQSGGPQKWSGTAAPEEGPSTAAPKPIAASAAPHTTPDPAALLVPDPVVPEERPGPGPTPGPRRRRAGGRSRFVVVRDTAEQELWAARRRARARLPSPAVVTRDIALALLEVEAGCRSAAQLERIFSPELWEAIEHRIGRQGGPLPSGRSLISVRCQEDAPGLADTVAVVRKGDLVRPVALRLDAGGGRWKVTELRWWRNETDTARTPGRDGGPG
jgi:hypothetical protein